MNNQVFVIGQRVKYAGYEMTVIAVCAGQLAGMYEVRNASGIACVSGSNLVAVSERVVAARNCGEGEAGVAPLPASAPTRMHAGSAAGASGDPAPVRQYGREDIDYESWYSPWMKQLARTKTRDELLQLLGVQTKVAERAGLAHLRAIEATHSMTSQSARRARGRNAVSAAGDYKIALNGALEIYDLFPEHARAALAKAVA